MQQQQIEGVLPMLIATSLEQPPRWSYLPPSFIVALVRLASGNRLSPAWAGAPAFYVCQLAGVILSTIPLGHFPS
jgi:hypothetical protein